MCLFNMKTVGSSKSSLDLQGPCETTAAHLAHPLEGEGGDTHADHGSMDTVLQVHIQTCIRKHGKERRKEQSEALYEKAFEIRG